MAKSAAPDLASLCLTFTVLFLNKLTKIPVSLRCVAVPVNCIFVVISTCFAKFKNVAHSLEPGETPS